MQNEGDPIGGGSRGEQGEHGHVNVYLLILSLFISTKKYGRSKKIRSLCLLQNEWDPLSSEALEESKENMGTLMASLQRLSKDIESLHVASDVKAMGKGRKQGNETVEQVLFLFFIERFELLSHHISYWKLI